MRGGLKTPGGPVGFAASWAERLA